MNTTDIMFRYESKGTEKSTQYVISAEVDGVTFPMMKLYSADDMYGQRLQKNYKDLVEMSKIASNISYLLISYAKTGRFNEVTYGALVTAYNFCIDTHLDYEVLLNKIKNAQSNVGWV
jgi:hypothetical protein